MVVRTRRLCSRACSATGGGNIALMVIGAIVFIVVGIFAFITSAKGRQSRPLGARFSVSFSHMVVSSHIARVQSSAS